MKGRIRIAAVGMVAMLAVTALTSTAGAASGDTDSISANGGFISLSLLNTIGLTGAESSAAAATGQATTASGTGICATLSESANTCPNTTAPSSSDLLNTTANATDSTAGTSHTAADACLLPSLSLLVVTAEAACGHAVAGEDASGNPSATEGEGDLLKLTVGLSSVPGLGSLSGLLGGSTPTLGALCPTTSGASTSTVTTPVSSLTAPLSGLLSTVQGLLGSSGLPLLSTVNGSSSDPLSLVCGLLNSLTGTAGGGLLNGLLSLGPNSPLLSITVGDSTSTLDTTTAANGDTIQTATGTTEAAEVNVLGMLDIKVLPNDASISLDTTTGQIVAPSVTSDVNLLSVSTGGPATTIPLSSVEGLINGLLQALGGVLNTVVNPQLNTIAAATTNVSADGRSGSAEASDLKLNLLDGLVVLNLGDAKVAASSNPAAPAIITTPATTPTTPAATPIVPASVVPGVTTVHTGEFWSGSLPIVLMAGMALAGLTMIGRRRIFSVARSVLLRRQR